MRFMAKGRDMSRNALFGICGQHAGIRDGGGAPAKETGIKAGSAWQVFAADLEMNDGAAFGGVHVRCFDAKLAGRRGNKL